MDSASTKKKDAFRRRKIIDVDWDSFEWTGGRIKILTRESAEHLAEVIRELIGGKKFTLQVWRDFTPPKKDNRCWGAPDLQIEGCRLPQNDPDFPRGVKVGIEGSLARLQLSIIGYDEVLEFPTTFVDYNHLLDLGERTTQVNTHHPGRVIIATWDYGVRPLSWVEYWELWYEPEKNDAD